VDHCGLVRRISAWLVCTVALLANCLSCQGREPRIARSRIFDEREPIVTIPFPRGESELTTHLPADVEELFQRAGSSAPAAVLVLGFAAEHDDLITNLALAERRAHAIARELVTGGVARDRIIVAGSEAHPSDEAPSRVEVMIVAGSRLAMLPSASLTDH
jgi:outer membrane protein OmpA-like peptidoglycan-associated protein